VVYYPQKPLSFGEGRVRLGDPAKGIIELKAEDLNTIWKSKALPQARQ
jgi:hypothetical protein